MTQIVQHLAEITSRYDAVFCDLWGCVHDGLKPFPGAVSALRAYRNAGGRVVLVTNSPQPRTSVEKQLGRIGVPHDCWDTIATSGDSARSAMYQGAVGSKIYFIGDGTTDFGFFTPLNILKNPVEIEKVPLAQAEGIVCTGPFDPTADLSVYRPDFLYAKAKRLKLLCANPDIVVDRGDKREWCAGALARLYTDMGGESLYFGKPHPPIYELARRRLTALDGQIPDDSRILAIGDGIGTDIQGGIGENIDTLFITGGLEATRFGNDPESPDTNLLEAWLNEKQLSPTYSIGKLR